VKTENTPYAASPGSSGLDDKLADRCGRYNEAFTHLWQPRVQSQSRRAVDCIGSVSAECGEFLGTLLVGTWPAGDGCRTSWEVVVKGREQHNRTWLIVH